MLPTAGSDTVVIVGFDGSAASTRALGLAALGLRGHPGRIEVVVVSPAPAAGGIQDHTAGRARAEVISRDAAGLEVRRLLSRTGVVWRLQGREGDVAEELVTAAEHERSSGRDVNVLIAVGRPHRGAAHSAVARLIGISTVPVLVTP